MGDSDLSSWSASIPAALEEMNASTVNIQQIAQYCKQSFQQSGSVSSELYGQTKQYTNDALINVAYHIHKVSYTLTNFLQVQQTEIERLELQIKTVADRLRAAHEQTGAITLRTMEAPRNSQRSYKFKKLEEGEVPETGKPLGKYQRTPINFSALEGV